MFTTERGVRALRYGVNVFDSARYSKSYCRRLEKYADRGFAIGLPGFLRERVSPTITRGSYVFILKYGMCFRVEAR